MLLVIASCGGQVADRPDGSAGVGGVGGALTDASSGGSGAVLDEPWDAMVDGAPATPEELCAMEGTPLPSPCTKDEMSYRLSRRWWQCSGQFVFNTEDAVGIEFTSDGHWYLLKVDSGGAVVKGTGSSYEGTWDMYGPSSSCGIQVDIYKGGMVGSFPIFAKQPSRVNLNTGGDGGAPVYIAIP